MRVTWNGRPFDAKRFAEDLQRQALKKGVELMLQRGRAAAASLIDPDSGEHPLVFAWKAGQTSVRISTSGSDRFALALEERLDKQRHGATESPLEEPVVYLAHATEDKSSARPIAEHLMANGIEVWFDEWEITAGASLRQRMDEGLGSCTHFVVLLTPASLTEPWVNQEMDAGFVRRVEGSVKFIPLRMGLPLGELPPLLKGMLSPEIAADNLPALDQLVSQIHGVSSKPPLGPRPRYVQRVSELAHFSPAAIAIGKHLSTISDKAGFFDPQMESDDLARDTGLSPADVELGLLDLEEAGMLEHSRTIGSSVIWPLGPLFITFDPHVHDWRPADDARTLAATMINLGQDEYSPDDFASTLDWPVRRMNAALHAVEAGGLAECHAFIGGGPWVVHLLCTTPQTPRAARAA